MTFYNEFDKNAAEWLRQLMIMGLINKGTIDERNIIELSANELNGHKRLHFFAGIGGWELALQLAGWPDNKPVVTASLPCQPFSTAGKRLGKSDERHLLPHFIELVKRSDWPVIFGEQVPGAIKHGWLDDLQHHLGLEGYTVGAAVLTAAGAGAPHIRQRLYWVAYRDEQGLERREKAGCANKFFIGSDSVVGGLGDTEHDGHITSATTGSYATAVHDSKAGAGGSSELTGAGASRALSNWIDCDWLDCRDNKHRPIKPGLKPLVNGLPKGVGYSSNSCVQEDETSEARVMRIKGYGNAIVPQVAALFIKEIMKIK